MLALLLWLHGCGSPPRSPAQPAAAGTGPTTAPVPAAPAGSSLGVESQWLKSWFEGTPVVIQHSASALSIDVPREFSFDTGQSKVKPPLAAVLEKVSQSLRRLPATRVEVAAPADGTTTSPLAQQRANQVRSQLQARGVPASQLGKAAPTTAAAVQLRIELASP